MSAKDTEKSVAGPVSPATHEMPGLWGVQTFLGLGIALALIGWLVTKIDLAQVWRDIVACDKWYAFAGLLAHYATYPIRGLRWKRALGHVAVEGGVHKFGLVVFFYNAVDNVVPGKLGDLYAAHLARINFRVRRTTALGSLFLLRLIDAWIVLVLAVLSSFLLFSEKLPTSVTWGLIGGLTLALVLTAILTPLVIYRKSLPGWVPRTMREVILAFQAGMWPARKELAAIGGLTVVVWMLEAVWTLCLMLAFDLRFSAVEIVFLLQLPLLASTFPLTPSGAGLVEATLYGCLRLLGIAHPTAASVTVLNRLIDFWLHIWLGLIAWLFRHQLGLYAWNARAGLLSREAGPPGPPSAT
jgi:uncharacterized protein (TIRG00374 family)